MSLGVTEAALGIPGKFRLFLLLLGFLIEGELKVQGSAGLLAVSLHKLIQDVGVSGECLHQVSDVLDESLPGEFLTGVLHCLDGTVEHILGKGFTEIGHYHLGDEPSGLGGFPAQPLKKDEVPVCLGKTVNDVLRQPSIEFMIMFLHIDFVKRSNKSGEDG